MKERRRTVPPKSLMTWNYYTIIAMSYMKINGTITWQESWRCALKRTHFATRSVKNFPYPRYTKVIPRESRVLTLQSAMPMLGSRRGAARKRGSKYAQRDGRRRPANGERGKRFHKRLSNSASHFCAFYSGPPYRWSFTNKALCLVKRFINTPEGLDAWLGENEMRKRFGLEGKEERLRRCEDEKLDYCRQIY